MASIALTAAIAASNALSFLLSSNLFYIPIVLDEVYLAPEAATVYTDFTAPIARYAPIVEPVFYRFLSCIFFSKGSSLVICSKNSSASF